MFIVQKSSVYWIENFILIEYMINTIFCILILYLASRKSCQKLESRVCLQHHLYQNSQYVHSLRFVSSLEQGYRILVLDCPGTDAAVGLPKTDRVVVPSCSQNNWVAAHRPLVHIHIWLVAVTPLSKACMALYITKKQYFSFKRDVAPWKKSSN